jgi:hypothetical protein
MNKAGIIVFFSAVFLFAGSVLKAQERVATFGKEVQWQDVLQGKSKSGYPCALDTGKYRA